MNVSMHIVRHTHTEGATHTCDCGCWGSGLGGGRTDALSVSPTAMRLSFFACNEWWMHGEPGWMDGWMDGLTRRTRAPSCADVNIWASTKVPSVLGLCQVAQP